MSKTPEYPEARESSGLYHYSIECPWCSWSDDSDKGSLSIRKNYEEHMERKHAVKLRIWRENKNVVFNKAN